MYKINSKSINIKFERSDWYWGIERDTELEKRVKALCILLGGYNKYGREVEFEVIREIRNKFLDSVIELENLLTSNK